MLAKAVILLFLVIILFTLGSSFVLMIRDKGEGERTLHRLMWRIGLSMFLLLLIYAMFQLGWIESSGGPINYGPGRQ